MPWDPSIYNQFKEIRYKPFFDLMDLIQPSSPQASTTGETESPNQEVTRLQCVDIGCGTGEQTSILSQKFSEWDFIGFDSSAQMLQDSNQFPSEQYPNLSFKSFTTEEFVANDQQYDLIFSNAALQWSKNHHELFPALINLIKPNGQFAVQMPNQTDNILNVLLLRLVQEEPFVTFLNGFVNKSPVLNLDEYATIMFNGGLNDLVVMQKIYPIITPDVDTLFRFISGSALIQYVERLSTEIMVQDPTDNNIQISHHDLFIREYKARIAAHFTTFPAIYAFKRTLLYGHKKAE